MVCESVTPYCLSQFDLYMQLEVDIYREYSYSSDRKIWNLIYVDRIVMDSQRVNTA